MRMEDDKMYDDGMIYGCRYCTENATKFPLWRRRQRPYIAAHTPFSHIETNYYDDSLYIYYFLLLFRQTTSENWLYDGVTIPYACTSVYVT